MSVCCHLILININKNNNFENPYYLIYLFVNQHELVALDNWPDHVDRRRQWTGMSANDRASVPDVHIYREIQECYCVSICSLVAATPMHTIERYCVSHLLGCRLIGHGAQSTRSVLFYMCDCPMKTESHQLRRLATYAATLVLRDRAASSSSTIYIYIYIYTFIGTRYTVSEHPMSKIMFA